MMADVLPSRESSSARNYCYMAVEPLFKQAPNTRSIRSLGVGSRDWKPRNCLCLKGNRWAGEELGSGNEYPFLQTHPPLGTL